MTLTLKWVLILAAFAVLSLAMIFSLSNHKKMADAYWDGSSHQLADAYWD